ncbi:hypothetical protein ACX27_07160 [Nostoc piscinale CENA21]|uniref:Uncharacterized protein n=1 Tax=Nostoc piscinale CENA21 TaxID=224013 RepID=A0A0M4SPZ3_9NOSO|nr:hypothetical protein [Nostoc piscinale]ALF52678.1 hypothetical protein ACX27_07160 [Nostoc piscinale CENA21]
MLQKNKIKNIVSGFLLLLLFHLASAIFILILAALVQSNYNLSLKIIVYGIYGFALWQLIYVIPFCLWLKHQDKNSLMQGVMLGAVMTFLLYGGCFLWVIYFMYIY